MAMITSIRTALPVAEIPQTGPAATRTDPDWGAAAPLSKTVLAEAPQQLAPKSGTGDPLLLAARLTSETTAAAAAEAARAAYIKASIAAGLNPLPAP